MVFKDVKWVPMGQDVVMAGRILTSYVEISSSNKEFQEPALSLGWPRGERSIQQEFSSADCTLSPVEDKLSEKSV